MIVSVGNAKEKWCPFDRGQQSPRSDGYTKGTCLGPECMMWKFWIPPPSMDITTPEKHGKDDNLKKGYCGLSGVY